MEEPDNIDLSEALGSISLPCGRVLPNRLVKAATYEHLCSYYGGPPNKAIEGLYERFVKGGWGMIITGNVQVSSQHLSLGADLLVPKQLTEKSIEPFKKLAQSMKACQLNLNSGTESNSEDGTLLIMQLSHAGRQSPNLFGGRWPFQSPLSASSTRVGSSLSGHGNTVNVLNWLFNFLLFQRAVEMTERDIDDVIDGFVRGARLAARSGLDGIEIHAAHGYLVAQFISRKTNLRRSTDKYSAPLEFLRKIVFSIRSAADIPKDFVVGIKLNVSDYAVGGINEEEGVRHLAEIASWNFVDFIEISGGDYESPEFMKASTSTRQAFFESFSRIAVEAVSMSSCEKLKSDPEISDEKSMSPLIMLTGGFRTRTQFTRVLAQRHAHLIGIARLAVLEPDLPRLLKQYQTERQGELKTSKNETWKWETRPLPHIHSPSWWPKVVGGGVAVAWYTVAMRRIALQRKQLSESCGWLQIILEMYLGIDTETWILIGGSLLFALIVHWLLIRNHLFIMDLVYGLGIKLGF